jgi:hypothetical protein
VRFYLVLLLLFFSKLFILFYFFSIFNNKIYVSPCSLTSNSSPFLSLRRMYELCQSNISKAAAAGFFATLLSTTNAAASGSPNPQLSTNKMHELLSALGLPDFEDLIICPSCHTAYGACDLPYLPTHNDIPRCDFIEFPFTEAAAPAVCNTPLLQLKDVRQHGKYQTELRTIKTAKYMPLRRWLSFWTSLYDRNALRTLLDGWRSTNSSQVPASNIRSGRSFEAGRIMSDIHDGALWKKTMRMVPRGGEDDYWVGLLCSFDFIAPFFKTPTARMENKLKKVGMMHVTIGNLPLATRFKVENVCPLFVLEGENEREGEVVGVCVCVCVCCM